MLSILVVIGVGWILVLTFLLNRGREGEKNGNSFRQILATDCEECGDER